MTWREQITVNAQRFGATTCGCVALYQHIERYMTPTGHAAGAAWPLCPRCLGLGIDLGMRKEAVTHAG